MLKITAFSQNLNFLSKEKINLKGSGQHMTKLEISLTLRIIYTIYITQNFLKFIA